MNSKEIDDVVRPIFQSMINNLPENLIKRVFFDTGKPEYFKFLPRSLKNDKNFIKDSIDNNMLELQDIPQQYRAAEYISKATYVAAIKQDSSLLSMNLYPQDKDIILAAVTSSKENLLPLIDSQFRKDEQLLMQVVKANPNYLYNIDSNLARKFRANPEVMVDLIKTNPDMFYELSEKQRSESVYLKLMLKDIPHYNEVKDYLSKNKDPEIALMAVKLTKKAVEYLHPSFEPALKQCESKKDIHFFKNVFNESKNAK